MSETINASSFEARPFYISYPYIYTNFIVKMLICQYLV